jgi:hypothetical protein
VHWVPQLLQRSSSLCVSLSHPGWLTAVGWSRVVQATQAHPGEGPGDDLRPQHQQHPQQQQQQQQQQHGVRGAQRATRRATTTLRPPT